MKVSLRLNSGKVLLQKMMYDMNQYGATPRDRLDPRLFDQPAAATAAETMRRSAPACGCDDGRMMREETAPRLERMEETPCAPDASDLMPAFAMVYSPQQSFRNIYCEEDALMRGTIFEELDKPFYGPACMGGGCNG